jgi:hypothetical protein
MKEVNQDAPSATFRFGKVTGTGRSKNMGAGRDKEAVSKIASPIGKARAGLVWSAATCRRF